MKKIICVLLVGIILCGLVACDTNKEIEETTKTEETTVEKVKYGTVTGEVTYKYNDYVGNRGDTGSTVLLISKNVTSLPDNLAYGMTSDLPEGCYATQVSGSGQYTFNNVPTGEYVLIFISKNTCPNPSMVAGFYCWGTTVYNMFSKEGQERASDYVILHKIHNIEITVTEGQNTYSHDFGITYI